MIRQTLCNDALPPLKRLRDYIDANIEHISQNHAKNGCLFGNFAVEASDHSEVLRLRVVDIFAEVQKCVAYCLGAAVRGRRIAVERRLRCARAIRGVVAARCNPVSEGATQPRSRRGLQGIAVRDGLALSGKS